MCVINAYNFARTNINMALFHSQCSQIREDKNTLSEH